MGTGENFFTGFYDNATYSVVKQIHCFGGYLPTGSTKFKFEPINN